MSDVVERRNEVETLSAELTRRVTLIDHHGRHSLTFSQQALRREHFWHEPPRTE